MASAQAHVPAYDTSKLKHVETQERQVLPTSAGACNLQITASLLSTCVVENRLHCNFLDGFSHDVMSLFCFVFLRLAAGEGGEGVPRFDQDICEGRTETQHSCREERAARCCW